MTRRTHMSQRLHEVARVATVVLIEVSPGTSGMAYVSRSLLAKLELAVIEAGYDVPAYRKRYRDKLRADNKQRRLERDAAAVAKLAPGMRVQVPLYSQTNGVIPRLSKGTVGAANRKLKSGDVYVIWDEYPASSFSALCLEPLR